MKELLLKNKPIIFKNNDFQTVQIKVRFYFKKDENYYAKFDILPGLIFKFSKKYPTEELFNLEQKKLYIISSFCIGSMIGDIYFFEMYLTIPNKDVLGINLYDEQFKYFSEMIYNPKVSNNSFDMNDVLREANNLKVHIERIKKDNISYALEEAKEVIDDVGELSSSIYNHLEQIDEVDGKNLYDYYLDKIYNNQPVIYVMGDVDNKEINSLCNKYLYRKKYSNKTININLENYLIPRKDVNDIIENSIFNDSTLLYFYKVKDMKYEDRIIINTIKELLSSLSSRLLNKKLRDKHDLVYSSFPISYSNYGVLGIVALINKDNLDEAKKIIKEVIDDLGNEDIISPLLDKIKEKHRLNLIKNLDEKAFVFRDNIIKDMGIYDSSEEYYQKLLKITANDISSFINRLVLDTIYFLKEGDHE